jgi:hypothetical protein
VTEGIDGKVVGTPFWKLHGCQTMNTGRDMMIGRAIAILCLSGAQLFAAGFDRCQDALEARSLWEVVNFEFGSHEISDAEPSLRCLAETLKRNPNYTVGLEGFTDEVGATSSNETLSLTRAESVKSYLLRNGAEEKQITVLGCSISHAHSNNSVVGRFRNRRVVVSLRDSEGNSVGQDQVCGRVPLKAFRLANIIEELRQEPNELSFLIVLVPDPSESPLGREFDIYLESVQSAFESNSYALTHEFLPWWEGTSSQTSSKKEKQSREHINEPGLLVFSRGNARMALLLVGETPSLGVNRSALSSALGALDLPNAKRINILGPVFSGSVNSLVQTITPWTRKLSIRVLSGTASNPGNQEQFRAAHVDYGSRATSDQQKIDEVQKYLLALGVRIKDNVAVLVESSVYGQTFKNKGFLTIPFPMHISYIRSAYAKSIQPLNEINKALRPTLTPGIRLKLDLVEPDESLEKLPLFGASSTPQSRDLVLAATLSTIAQSRISVVGIVATDIKDKLFLAQEVRKSAPDVRLFALEGDLLMSHPDVAEACRGMVVFSSHPLKWSDPSGGLRIQFASESAQGVFEAARFFSESPGGEGIPEEMKQNRAIWTSVVGRGGLFPLRLSNASYQSQFKDRLPPRAWLLVFILSGLGICGVCVVILQGFSMSTRLWILLVLLLGGYIALAVPFLYFTSGEDGWLISLVLYFGALVISLIITTCLAGLAPSYVKKRANPTAFIAVPIISAIFLTIWLIWQASQHKNPQAVFDLQLLSDRSLALVSGVSPTLPIILLLAIPIAWIALSLWTTNRKKFRTIDQKERLTASLMVWLGLAIIGAPAIHLAFYYRDWNFRVVRGIEVFYWFDIVVTLLLVLAVALLTEAGFRTYFLWRQNHELVLKGRKPDKRSDSDTANPSDSPQDGSMESKAFVRLTLPEIQWRMVFVTAGLILTLVAISSYPFEPERVLMLYLGTLVIAFAVFSVFVIWRMGNGDLARFLGQEQPSLWDGKRAAGFVLHGGLPALTLLVSRFPPMAEYALSWLQPLYKAFE